MERANTPNRAFVQVQSKLGGLAFARVRDAETRDHLAQLLARRHMPEPRVGDLLEVEEGEALRKELAVDDALAKAWNHPKSDAPGELVESGADALQIMRFDVLEAVSKDHPVDALAGLLRAGGSAVPDELGIEARLGYLVILGVHLTDQNKIDETV